MKPSKWVPPALTAGTTASQAFVACVAAAAEQIDANTAGMLAASNPEYLHQLRIGLRRMRSTLRAFHGLVRRRRASAFDEELRSTLRILGEARDWDEFHQSELPVALRRQARAPHARALRKAKAAVRRGSFQTLIGRLERWARSQPWRRSADPEEPIGKFGARALNRLHSDLSRCAKDIDWADGKRRHRVRIRAKRLRYGLDCFASGFAPQSVEKSKRNLRHLQEILGEANDCRVQRMLLGRLAPLGGSVQSAKLQTLLASGEQALSGQAADAWSKLKAPPRDWRRKAAPAAV